MARLVVRQSLDKHAEEHLRSTLTWCIYIFGPDAERKEQSPSVVRRGSQGEEQDCAPLGNCSADVSSTVLGAQVRRSSMAASTSTLAAFGRDGGATVTRADVITYVVRFQYKYGK